MVLGSENRTHNNRFSGPLWEVRSYLQHRYIYIYIYICICVCVCVCVCMCVCVRACVCKCACRFCHCYYHYVCFKRLWNTQLKYHKYCINPWNIHHQCYFNYYDHMLRLITIVISVTPFSVECKVSFICLAFHSHSLHLPDHTINVK